MSKIDDDKKQLIIKLKSEGYTWKEISNISTINVHTARSFYRKYNLNKNLPLKIRYKKTKITAHIGLYIKQIIPTNPNISIRKLTNQINEKFDINISTSPVRLYLKKNNYKKSYKFKKIYINKANILKRRLFAEKYKLYNMDFYRNIIWSDEYTVRVGPTSNLVMQ